MSAIIIDGKEIARQIRADAAAQCAELKTRYGITPALAVILVGDDAASVSYVTGKRKALAEAGMEDRSILLPRETDEAKLLSIIQELNADASVHGILVQLPLPPHINADNVINAINPLKDVDGFCPVNVGKMCLGLPAPLPCTPHGIVQMLKRTGIKASGANAVIIGRSNIVGKPLAMLLMRRDVNATVTVCHTGTKDLGSITRQADILIAAAGRPHTITADMVKAGAAVIDVGVNRILLSQTSGLDATKKSRYRLVGDVDFDAVKEVAGYITPVPGGVGPMTIAMLMMNVVQCAGAA